MENIRAKTLHDVGALVEKLQVAYEREIDTYAAMHIAYDTCCKQLCENNMQAAFHVVQKLDTALSIKHQNALGAKQCLQSLVQNIKEMYDAEFSS